jgi:putative ABC transport system permease protein
MRERHRDRRGLPVVEELGRDLRFSFRSLRRDSGFTFAVCFVMALAIGAGTAIFSVVDAVVLRGLPYDEHDRIAALRTVDSQNATIFGGRSTIQTFLDWQRLQRSFEQIALVDTFFFQIRNERDEPARTPAAQVHADVFRVLRVQPFLGRLLTAEDHRPGQARVALLSHRFWVQRFGADPNAIGQTLELDGAPWRVVGVLPPFFAYPPAAEQPTDLYVPHELRAQDRIRGGSRNYNGIVIGRLKPGVTYASAQAEMNTIAEALERDYPKWEPGRRVNVVPLHQQLVGEARSWMWLLLGAVTLLLVIACANVANLMLVRAAARSREMALRTALGAARGRIVRALLVESVTLSLVAGVVGLGIAYGGIQVLLAWLPDGLPRVAEVAMNVRVLGVALGVATVTGVIFGLVPGLPRAESFLVHALRDGDRATTMSRAGRRLRSALVIAEVAVAVVLVAGAGLFVVSFAKVIGIEPGFDYRNIVVMDLVFSRNPEIDADVDSWMRRGQAQVTEAIEALSHVPAVANVAGVSGGMPLSSGYSRVSLILPERGEIMGNSPDAIDFRRVTPNYFTLLSIPVLRGRAFTPEDDANAPQVAIVNESAATRYWPGQDAIGQRLVIQDKERTIVGIVRDIRQYGPEQSARQGAFVPLAQEPTNGSQLLIKVAGDVNQIVPTLKSVIWSFNRNQFLPPRTTTMEGLMEGLIAERRFNMAVLAILGALALTMAAAGIFSVIACVVSQRQHEIGVRMALGSAPGTIVTMIFKQVAALLTVGFVAGCAGAWYLMSFAEAFLFQVSAADVRVLASALALLAFVGIVAAVIPARRAAGIDPLQVLRE